MSLHPIHNLIAKAKLALKKSNNIEEIELVRIKFLGKNGYINKYIRNINYIKLEEKNNIGTVINKVKKDIYKLYVERKDYLQCRKIERSLIKDTLDITLPGRLLDIGSTHPITNIIERVKPFFISLGFTIVHGPEVENDYFNFKALNIPAYHPSRDDHDTFWFDKKFLLRTHTSGIQIRSMNNKVPPIRIISFGRVYRRDYDKNHTPMFHQMEGVVVDKNLNFSNLKKILYDFLNYFFEKNIILRFRPSFFPFTEPSAEIDVINNQSNDWLELLGCGMIHPKILHNVNIDTKKFTGFAFGIGIERLAMLFYNINDMRFFFENDLSFLNQFK